MTDHGTALLGDPVAQELLRSRIPARLAYTWTDGTPRVVPIWFHWTGEEVVVASPAKAPKATAIADGARVAVTIDGDSFPYRVLLLRGVASVERRDAMVEEYAQAALRYFGEEQGRAWIDQLPPMPMVRIGIRPDHVSVLDFETRFPSALSS